MQCVHRARLLDGLVELVPNKRCHFNKRLMTIDEGKPGEKSTLHFKDGTTAQADAVIGADGVHSKVRLHILGEDHPAAHAVFTGAATYRSVVSMDKAVERVGAELAQNAIMLCGPRRAILSYPIEHGDLLNVVGMEYDLGDTWPHKEWIVPTKPEELKEKYKGWGEAAQGMTDVRTAVPRISTPLLTLPAHLQH